MSRLDYPLHFDGRGRSARVDESKYIRDLIEQVLLTAPGERVMRPDFGSGVSQLLFGPASPEVAATTQFLVQGALEQWLGSLIDVEAVQVQARDNALSIEVRYLERRSGASGLARVTAPGGGS